MGRDIVSLRVVDRAGSRSHGVARTRRRRPREAGVGDALKVLQATYLAYASGCLPLIGWRWWCRWCKRVRCMGS